MQKKILASQTDGVHVPTMPAVSRTIGLVAGLYLLVGGMISLLGWVLDVPRFTDWFANGISIMPNAAVCVLFSGASLVAISLDRRRLALSFGMVVAFFAYGTAVEHMASVQLFDTWLLFGREWGRGGVTVPGRMGLPGTLSWCAISAALILLGAGPRYRRAVPILGVAVLTVSALSLTGYLFQAEALYAIPTFTVIALQTALFVFAGGVGLVTLAHDYEPMRTLVRDDAAGALARRVVPWVLATPLLVGWLRVVGEDQMVFGSNFGTAFRSVLEMLLLGFLLWWGIRLIAEKEQALNLALDAERDLKNELARREEFAQGILATLPDTFCVLDNDWRFTYVNEHFATRTGKSVPYLLGKEIWEEFPEAVGTEGYHKLRAAKEAGTDVEYDIYYEPYQRHFRDKIHVTASGVSMYSTDITESKKHEQALQDVDRRKDVFLATLAHELRNPLGSISLALDLMRMTRDETVIAEAKATMDRQATHMVRLIDDLLDVSRIKLGKINLQTSRVDLRSIAEAAVEDCAPVMDLAGHDLTVDLPPEPVYVEGDDLRLTQVIGNLLRNACKYTPDHGAIILSLRRDEGFAVISVKDNGVGIAHDCIEEIFEPFAQVDQSRSRSQGGLGVGLMLSRRLVALHGGELTAQSDGLGKGSEFTVRLPLAPGPAGVAAVTVATPRPLLDCRILVVEDNRDIARCISVLLEETGCELRTAHDGEDALEHATQFLPDVILLDIGLPDMTGYEVCEAIRAKPWGKDIRVIALTGWGGTEDLLKSELAGFDAHVTKPIDLDALLHVLKQHAKRRV